MPELRETNFRSQQDFRRQLIGALLAMGKDSNITPKRRISRTSQGANEVPVHSHQTVKMSKRG